MTKQIFATAVLCIGAALLVATPAHADNIVRTTPSYDSTENYDFATTFPDSSYHTIGTFGSFTIPAGGNVVSITISGTFGNADVPTTALSDYYLGYAGNEMAVKVAACDDPTSNCYSGQEGPYSWTATLNQSQIQALATGLAAGSLDFGYTWDSGAQPIPDFFSPTGYDAQYVYAGQTTLDIVATPEPSSIVLCLTGLAGLIAIRRFRKPEIVPNPTEGRS
jgi:hypothetical protein